MKSTSMSTQPFTTQARADSLSAFAVGLLAALCSTSAVSAVPIDNKPLTVSNSVPGNMVLVPSFEWPTAITHANDPGKRETGNNSTSYNAATVYSGYFNSAVCYDYVYAAQEDQRYFRPAVAAGSNHSCSGKWSGNFMNWATAQAVDTFRMALTGGYRVRDEANGTTWLEKARSDRYIADYNDFRRISSGVSSVMPGSFTSVRTRIGGLHNQMWFIGSSTGGIGGNGQVTVGNGILSDGTVRAVPYNPSQHTLPNSATSCRSNFTLNTTDMMCKRSGHSDENPTFGNNTVYTVSVRVQVCDGTIDRRGFCARYGSHWKPEGLIQGNSKKLRYSVFGYQTSDLKTEGALLRARQKLVGPVLQGEKPYPDRVGRIAGVDNPEWDAATGVILANPDAGDALATTTHIGGNNSIRYSGVINYINRFGQIDVGNQIPLKGGYSSPYSICGNSGNSSCSGGADNVSDLYYAALRYLRGMGGESSGTYANRLLDTDYAGRSGTASTNRYRRSDGMPAIRDWYGTGDEQPVAWGSTQRVGADKDPILYQCQTNVMLGIGDTSSNESRSALDVDPTIPNSYISSLSGKGDGTISLNSNKNVIAALAMWSHLNDLRPDVPNTVLAKNDDGTVARARGQSVSTYWVDVVERNDYLGPTTNQYYLATKYGGFRIPETSYDANGNASVPTQAWWSANRSAWTTHAGNNVANSFAQPNNLFFANNGQAMIDSLTAAFSRITDDISGSGGSFASNTTKLEVGARTYQAKYISNGWGGRLTASDVDVSTGTLTDRWDASDWLGQAAGDTRVNASATVMHYTQRKLLYSNGGTLANFISNWTGSTLASPTVVKPTGLSTLSNDQLRYILGDRTHERQSAATGSLQIFRNRRGMLGDIINSTPVYVGKPNANLHAGDTSYASFAAANANRKPAVYVGANDGMLHAFKAPDASTACTATGADCGRELFAFMPTEAMAVLQESDPSTSKYPYWDPQYDHAYSVDGEITVADIKDGTTWRTVLVGTMGRGGKSIFALDVTNPDAPSLLWEKTVSDAAVGTYLGNALGRPIIAKVADGDWRVFLGNGPNSTSDSAVLIMLDAATGANKGSINTAATGDNGLSAVNVWDERGTTIPSKPDGNFDTVYAGDLRGNLWKFDLATNAAIKLYTTRTGQPITAAPLVAKNPYKPPETWVFFGTGRYLSMADTSPTANQTVQSWYGIIDRNALVTEAGLKKSSITHEDEKGRVIEKTGAPGTDGWYIDLRSPAEAQGGTPRGERMVVPNFFQGLALIGTTRFPDSTDPCAPSGKGFTMAIDPFTGGRLNSAFFDIDYSGTVGDNGDFQGGNTSTPYSGIGYGSGPNNPIFLGSYMYTSLDDGTYSKIKTSGAQALVKRVSWRELINVN